MKPKKKVEETIRGKLRFIAGSTFRGRLWTEVMNAQEESIRIRPASYEPGFGRTIMRSPITKIAIAAAVIVAVLLGISQLGGSPAGVAWGEVAKKVEASRGVIYRELRGSERPTTDSDRAITYLTPAQYRSDSFQKNQPSISMYDNRAAGKRVVLLHAHKGYVLEDFSLTEQSNRKHANYQDPAWWVQTFLTCKYTKLAPKEIEGVLCEGIETTDLALLADHENSVKSLVARLWVSVETGYPVLFDGEFHGAETSYTIFDQFQWDVKIDPAVFEPNIPAGYEQM